MKGELRADEGRRNGMTAGRMSRGERQGGSGVGGGGGLSGKIKSFRMC